MMGVTYGTALRNVERLVQAGILELVRETSYGKTYVANGIMDVIRWQE